MLTVDEAFRKFKSRLELNDREQANASARQTEVRDYLDSKFKKGKVAKFLKLFRQWGTSTLIASTAVPLPTPTTCRTPGRRSAARSPARRRPAERLRSSPPPFSLGPASLRRAAPTMD